MFWCMTRTPTTKSFSSQSHEHETSYRFLKPSDAPPGAQDLSVSSSSVSTGITTMFGSVVASQSDEDLPDNNKPSADSWPRPRRQNWMEEGPSVARQSDNFVFVILPSRKPPADTEPRTLVDGVPGMVRQV